MRWVKKCWWENERKKEPIQIKEFLSLTHSQILLPDMGYLIFIIVFVTVQVVLSFCVVCVCVFINHVILFSC